MFMRLILLVLFKKWLFIYLKILEVILRHPEYASLSGDIRIFVNN
jgi:hypothetical protein